MTTPLPVYAIFAGYVEQDSAKKLISNLHGAVTAKIPAVHLLFQCAGGTIGDGVFLYNLLRALPIELTMYNCGQISSAGVTAYLGAKKRVATANSTFMLHRSANNPNRLVTTTELQQILKTLAIDDERVESILKAETRLTDDQWQEFSQQDLYLSGKTAVECGLSHSIGEFSPPLGYTVFNFSI